MSNSDIIKGAYDAFARQDIPGVLSAFAPDIVWYSPDTVRNGGTYKGHDEVLGFFGGLSGVYNELHVQPQQLVEQDGTVVVLGHHSGTGANGSFAVPFVHVWSFRDGKATSFTEYFDTVRMNEAVG